MTVTALHPYTLGASTIPAVLDLDPFDSPYALGARMLDGRDNRESEAATMGLALEPAHAALVEQAGYAVMPAPADGFTHPELPWLVVHPDGLIALPLAESGEVEVACAHHAASLGAASGIGPLELKLRGIAPSDRLVTRDTVQSLVQVHAMGAAAGLVSVLHGGYGGIRRDQWQVDADTGLFAAIVDRCERFLDGLRRGRLPAPDGSEATRDAIRERFAHGEPGKVVRLDQEAWAHLRRGREYAEQEARAKRLKEREFQHVQDFMGDAVEAVSPYDTTAARWTPVSRTSVDTAALKRDRPEVAGEYAKTTTTRRFEANPA